MYNYYGIYTSCRDAAWRCHLDFQICRMPVKLTPIAKQAGIRVHRNSTVNELRRYELGASIFADGSWHIVYDDRLSSEETRMVLAHELGHIFLGHEYKYAEHRFAGGSKKLLSESEADMFAVRLLAPACVLHELGQLDAHSIKKICEIPYRVAAERAKRMDVLEKRGLYYRSELEREVLKRFSNFIYTCRKNPSLLNTVPFEDDIE